MRITSVRFPLAIALPLIVSGPLLAAEPQACPDRPDALGTSRTIVVDPTEHTRIGTMNYLETLPLAEKEVVLTFDDGPLPPYTDRVLEVLASECVRATFFIVGRMAKAYPERVRRVHAQGHTVGTHSMNHPFRFRALKQARAEEEIEAGITATAAALGDETLLAPFFRFPGLGRTPAFEEYLASRGLMAWSADVPGDDWRRIKAQEIVRRSMNRLETKGKGVLLLHDIQPATALALPMLLDELKAGGFRIVHVQPVAAGRPATMTVAEDWRLRPRTVSKLPPLSTAALMQLRTRSFAMADADARCMATAPQPRRQIATAQRKRQHAADRSTRQVKRAQASMQPAPSTFVWFGRPVMR